MPINLIHLSDIHFMTRHDGRQFDIDQSLRDGLLESLAEKPEGCEKFDGVLVSGDIAYSGQAAEYAIAQSWLKEVCERGSCDLDAVYVVPGNHDVNREFVAADSHLWASHKHIRDQVRNDDRDRILAVQLEDKTLDVLYPLREYNDFSQRYECLSTDMDLAWEHELPRRLDDGARLVLHGLNSAILSDRDDAPGRLFLSSFQLTKLRPEPDTVRVVLSHHPPDWLADKMRVDDCLLNRCPLQLFGHEHTARVRRVDQAIRVYSGAVHPARAEGDWKPCFHLLQLDVVAVPARALRVRVHTREWRTDEQKFLPAPGVQPREEVLPLPQWDEAFGHHEAADAHAATVECALDMPTEAANPPATPNPAARRRLIVHFHGLGTPAQMAIVSELDLWREGDDMVQHGHELWTVILNRAGSLGKLGRLWAAVSVRDASLQDEPNPFED